MVTPPAVSRVAVSTATTMAASVGVGGHRVPLSFGQGFDGSVACNARMTKAAAGTGRATKAA